MFNEIVHDGYHVDTVLRSDLTKALTMLVPEVLEETKVTLPEVFKTQDTGRWMLFALSSWKLLRRSQQSTRI